MSPPEVPWKKHDRIEAADTKLQEILAEAERLIEDRSPQSHDEVDLLRQEIELLRQSSTECKRAEEALGGHLKIVQLLSASATHLLEPLPENEVFEYTARQLHMIAGNAIVVVSDYDPTTNQTTVRAVAGPEQKLQRELALLGRSLVGLAFTVAEGTLSIVVPGNLARVGGGLYDLSFRQLPETVCREIEQKLDLGEVYVMPFVQGEDYMGSVAIITDRNEGLINRGEIELLVNQAGLALKRNRAEAALKEYADRLKRSNEDLERFAYVSSHDLQEPLRTIVTFTQLLERRYKGQMDKDADEYIGFIVEAGTRMQTLINDLLDFSRVSTRGGAFAIVDTEALLDQTLANLQTKIEDSGAEITRDPLPRVKADPSQLVQVFQNLIGNAIKFRREGVQPRIHLSARRTNGMVQFSVADNGIGIDPQYLGRIFVIFQRLHGRDKYPGTGIGLAITKRIVERHGGRIWAESEPGTGSIFYFTIPA
ncbi:MAG: GHKL domain-containing protein [Methanobacteriota archaeon]|nr:MAG: GHKL domain-containing protein [Euryarchaeota archaeon]